MTKFDRYHHGSLRETMLAGAKKALDEGRQVPTMRDLAKAADVSSGAPYRHFKSRADFLAALEERYGIHLQWREIAL